VLAHPQQAIINRKTIASLISRFGTTSIDLHDYYQQKAFYRSLAQMLMAIDAAVYAILSSRAA
jgi:hypothetical protein